MNTQYYYTIKRNVVIMLGIMVLMTVQTDTVYSATPPAPGDYQNSSHGNSTNGVDRSLIDGRLAGYSKGNCGHCHLQHASVTDDTSHGTYTTQPNLLANLNNVSGIQFCTECHDTGGPATDDIATGYAGSVGHGPSAGNVSCSECHNPHLAQAPGAEAARGNDATSGSLKGVSGVEPASWPNPIPTAGTEPSETQLAPSSYNFVDPVTTEYQVCFKCHSNFNGGPVGTLSNQAAHFNPNNYAHHPVTGTGQWRNPTIRANLASLKAPWSVNLDARMYCSDCHGSDISGSPRGPHGSNKQYLLKAWGHPTNANASECYDNLCLLCHHDDYDGGGAINSPWSHGSNANHQYSGENPGDNTIGCRACHGGPAGRADFTLLDCPPPSPTAGGRIGAIHGEKFYWNNPAAKSGKNCTTDYTPNPADHFLMGGYLTGIYLDNYHGGADGDGTCWATGTGTDPCGSMTGGKGW